MSNNIRVLIVDDLPETRENVRKLLQFEAEIEVIGQAGTGEESVQIAKEHKPDIILMDINMPGIDGIGASHQITDSVPNAQIIIMSVQSDPNYLRRAMMAGAKDFLTKPFGGDELVKAIYRVHKKNNFLYSSGEDTTFEFKLAKLEVEIGILDIIKLTEKLELYSNSIVQGKLVDELSQITAGLAHDLRSPINLITSNLLSLENPSSNSESIKKYILRVWKRVLYCRWLIDNFLGVSFNEKQVGEKFPVYESIVGSINILRSRYPHVNFQINIPRQLKIFTDKRIFDVIIMNILSNAFEELPEGGEIYINSRRNSSDIKISITDSGQFGPPQFIRIGHSTKPAHSGLGLYVATRLIKQQLGEIYFSKNPEGKGTRVILLFPKERSLQKEFTEIEQYIKQETKHQDIVSYSNYLTKKLENLRSRPLTKKNREFVSKEFQSITTTFARNLYNELGLIEATVKELLAQSKNEQLSRTFQKIAHNCAYSQLLVRNMIEIGESTSPSWSSVNVVAIIEEVLDLLERKIPPNLFQIYWNIDLTVGNIEADEIQIKQIFMNLIKNALDAMPNGGKLTIGLTQNDQEVQISIKDTGIGIPEENMPKLFSLGFTTKISGYGIGLYSINEIVKKHNGNIKAFSNIREGTTFVVTLPVYQ